MPMQTKPSLSKPHMIDIIIKEYNRLINNAKEELGSNPGNDQIKYHYHALINELMVVAVDLGLLSMRKKNQYQNEAIEELGKF